MTPFSQWQATCERSSTRKSGFSFSSDSRVCEVQVARTMLPAALPDRMPVGASSMQTHSSGLKPLRSAPSTVRTSAARREGSQSRGGKEAGKGDRGPRTVRVGLRLALLDRLGRDEDLGRRQAGEGDRLRGVEVGRYGRKECLVSRCARHFDWLPSRRAPVRTLAAGKVANAPPR